MKKNISSMINIQNKLEKKLLQLQTKHQNGQKLVNALQKEIIAVETELSNHKERYQKELTAELSSQNEKNNEKKN